MASYVIAGASRGIGYQYLRTLAANPSNTVVGLARNAPALRAQLSADGLSNVHVFPGDLTDPASLAAAAASTSSVTGGKVDHLIVNGAYISNEAAGITPTGFAGQEELLKAEMAKSIDANVLGVIYAVNAFLPLVKASLLKKVVVISSGMTEPELIKGADVAGSVTYAASKAAANVVVYKYAVELKKDGVMFLLLSPGVVKTGLPEEIYVFLTDMFQGYKPGYSGPLTTEESVDMMLKVIGGLTLENSGAFLSHLGTKEWL